MPFVRQGRCRQTQEKTESGCEPSQSGSRSTSEQFWKRRPPCPPGRPLPLALAVSEGSRCPGDRPASPVPPHQACPLASAHSLLREPAPLLHCFLESSCTCWDELGLPTTSTPEIVLLESHRWRRASCPRRAPVGARAVIRAQSLTLGSRSFPFYGGLHDQRRLSELLMPLGFKRSNNSTHLLCLQQTRPPTLHKALPTPHTKTCPSLSHLVLSGHAGFPSDP